MIIKTSFMPFVLSLRSSHRIPCVPIVSPVKDDCENSYNPRYKANPGYNSIKMIHPPEEIVQAIKSTKERLANMLTHDTNRRLTLNES